MSESLAEAVFTEEEVTAVFLTEQLSLDAAWVHREVELMFYGTR